MRRILRLEGDDHTGAVRFLTGLHVTLEDGRTVSTVTVTRTGRFSDPRYGQFEITREMLLAMVKNFEARVYGQDIFIDISHRPENGAAGKVVALTVEGDRLRARVEWTPFGVEAIRGRGYQYLSAEYSEHWKDNEAGTDHGPVLLGAALTVRPVIKRLDPIQLAEDIGDGHAVLLHPTLAHQLTEEIKAMKDKYLKLLPVVLAAIQGLPEAVVTQLSAAFGVALDGITEEAKAKVLLETFKTSAEQLGKQLTAASGAAGTLTLDFSGLQAALAAGGTGLKPEDITRLLDEREAKRAEDAKKLAERRTANVKVFTDALAAAEGLKALREETRRSLAAAADLITADMTEEQVRKLAEHQVKIGTEIAVAAQLAARGFVAAGSPHITMDETNAIKALQETVDKRLGIAGQSDAKRYAPTGGKLLDENKRLADQVLGRFDAEHAAQLHAEHKMLAGGDGKVSDVNVPVVWERTVIREALYRLVGLQFVDSGSVPFATSYVIPYSYRDSTGAGRSDTRKYEGQSIARAGVIQTADTAYNTPQKLAFEVSDELRYLTAAGHINWDAVSENQANASRIIGEDIEHLLFNEVQRAADEYSAVAAANENLELQADDAKRVFVLAGWPVVRPRKIYDLQGNQVGATVNPITVTYNAVALSEYDGTGTQAAGTYYVLDYQLGEIYLVNQAGAIQTPANATAYTISYSHTPNCYKFDTDLPANTKVGEHWDTFLYRYGLRKAVVEDERFHMANFGLMSGTVMTQIEQAQQFGANAKRAGTDLQADGNLGRVKDIPNFKTSAPGLWMGDRRIIIGERGVTRFRMAKPWQLGQLENQKDANGRFTGKKEAYGDQFVVVHTPAPLKRAYTSIVLYGAAARIARVNP